jgi:hypothetical protein
VAEIASAFVTIAPSTRGFGTRLSTGVSSEVSGAGRSIGRTFGKMFVLGASVIAAAGIGRFLSGSIDEAREAQKVGAQTNAVLKSTGGVANVSAKSVGLLATSLSNKIGVDDEAIQAGENMLLTFTNVRNEVGKGNQIFADATKTVQDMAAAFGGDAVSNSKILGKALNDPTKGVSALTRVGVTFTEKQKEQIKAFQESGNILGAQKIILGELAKETAGSAEAQVTNADKARVAYGNLKEQIGTALLPVIDKLAGVFTSKIAPAISTFISNLGSGKGAAGAFGKFLTGTLLPALSLLWGVFKNQILPVVGQFVTFYVTKVIPAVAAFEVALAQRLYPVLMQVVGIIRDQVIPTVTALAQFFIARIVPVLVNTAQVVATNLRPVFEQLVTTFQTKVLPGISKLLAKFEQYRPTIQRVVEVAVKLSAGMLKIASAVLGKVLPVLIRLAAFLIGTLFANLGRFIGQVIESGRQTIEFGKKLVAAVKDAVKFAQGVIDQGKKVVGWFKDLPTKIKQAIGNARTLLLDVGKHIIEGLKRGIEGAAHLVEEAVQAIINKIPKKIRQLMHIGSPSKVTEELGGYISEGLARGIAGGTDKVAQATDKLTKKVKEKVAKLRDSLASVKSDFASLAEPIASNFTQGLFDFDTAGAFTANLTAVKGTLTTLLANFKKLIGEGLSPGFLYQLFQSGGPGLINSLAGLSKADAQAAGGLFGEVTSLSEQLGSAVAGATDKGAALENQTQRLERKLDHLINTTKKVGQDVGREVNGAASQGRRRAA